MEEAEEALGAGGCVFVTGVRGLATDRLVDALEGPGRGALGAGADLGLGRVGLTIEKDAPSLRVCGAV